jgi:soluble cytochrome b562
VSGLDAEQREKLASLVGAELARADEPAVEAAYADFRAGMDRLARALDGAEVPDGRR